MAESPIIAVDVALLFPDPLRQWLVATNHTLRPPPGGFRFDATHLPHLTLAQQFVRRADAARLRAVIADEVEGQRPVALETTQLRQGRTTSTLGVGLTHELSDLHRRLMTRLRPWAVDQGGPDAFWTEPDGAPRAADIEWVTGFQQRSAFDAFDPHVTLGVGAVEPIDRNFRFVAGELALCQLGRFCTCRRVLEVWTLTPPRR